MAFVLVRYIRWYWISGAHSGEDSECIWVRTLCSLMHAYEGFGGTFSVCHHRQSEDGASMS